MYKLRTTLGSIRKTTKKSKTNKVKTTVKIKKKKNDKEIKVRLVNLRTSEMSPPNYHRTHG